MFLNLERLKILRSRKLDFLSYNQVYRERIAKVEVTIPLGSIATRAEDVSQDMYGSIDLVSDKIERQIVRINKNEKKNRVKSGAGKLLTDVPEANNHRKSCSPQKQLI